jgi:hypothetical protein
MPHPGGRHASMHILSEAIPDVMNNKRAILDDNAKWFILNIVILTKQ